MIKLLVLLLLLLAAVWIGWEMHQDSGYIFIKFHNMQLEISVWTAASVILAAYIILYFIIRLIIRGRHWPQQWRLWRQESRQNHAQRSTEFAACELIEERWELAEQYFHKAAEEIHRPLLCYIGAAIAAQAQGANLRREEYLDKAYKLAPEAEITLGILQAKLQIQGNQLAEAAVTLKKLHSAVPQHPVVKKLLTELDTLNLTALSRL